MLTILSASSLNCRFSPNSPKPDSPKH